MPEAVVRSRYGDEFRYRTDLAAKMMTNPSFLQEIKYANKDLSLISARVVSVSHLYMFSNVLVLLPWSQVALGSLLDTSRHECSDLAENARDHDSITTFD